MRVDSRIKDYNTQITYSDNPPSKKEISYSIRYYVVIKHNGIVLNIVYIVA